MSPSSYTCGFGRRLSAGAGVAALLAFSAVLVPAALVPPAHADDVPPATGAGTITLPETVVTATGIETEPDKVGSAVSVVRGSEIEKRGKLSLIDALAGVPGLSFTRTGGIGSVSQIRLRGGNPGDTQVLLDGVQLNDGASTDNSFDFDALVVSGIDRIEVLRGPQSALYGNDAMSGVVNIITKPGRGPLKAAASAEVGSFDTVRTTAGVSGGGEKFGVAINASRQRSGGFTRVSNTSEKDGFDQRGINGSANADLTENWRVTLSGGVFDGRSEYDNFGADGYNDAKKVLRYGKLENAVTLFDGRLENILTLYTMSTDRSYNEPTGWYAHTNYATTRNQIEYRGNLKIGSADVLTFGAARKRESALIYNTLATGSRSKDVDRTVNTNSFYSQYLLNLGERLNLTFGARRDDNEAFGARTTYRVTGAYHLLETGSILRASIGTGAKAPTLYQLYAPIYGNSALRTEKSVGADVGVEQPLLDGRLVGSAGLFWNRFENLINFENSHYVNVGKAHTQGAELAARWAVTRDVKAKASYTYTLGIDDSADRWLARRPRHLAALSADWAVTEALSLGGTVKVVGKQLDSTFTNQVNNVHTVADIDASYALTGNVSVFGRIENLFNADYEEVRGYNTPGRAGYVGFKVKM